MFDPKEENRTKRRDKKTDKRKNGMRINRGAVMLANVLAQKYQKLAFYSGDRLNHLKTIWGIYPKPQDWEGENRYTEPVTRYDLEKQNFTKKRSKKGK